MTDRIRLECPTCHKTMLDAERQDHDPPNAVLAMIYCEKCVQGGYDDTSYYDADGKEIMGPFSGEADDD